MADIDWEQGDIKPPAGASNETDWDAGEIRPPPEPKGVLGHVRDTALSFGKGIVGVPELAVGLADIPTGGQVGKFLENKDGAIGFRPREAREYLGALMTDRAKQQQQDFQNAEGIVDKAKVALSNPSLITNAVAESLPIMGAGGVAGRALLSAVPRIGPALAGAAGEGIASAGSAAEQIRQETDDGWLTGKQAALAGASGIGATIFGALGAKFSQRLGIGDVDTLLAAGGQAAVAANARAAAKRLPRKALAAYVWPIDCGGAGGRSAAWRDLCRAALGVALEAEMTRLLALITGNPWVLAWIVIGAFASGFGAGLGAGWYVQGVRIERAAAEHARYVAEAEINAAKARQALADQKAQWLKEKEDAQIEADERLGALQTELFATATATATAAGKLRDTVGALRAQFADASQPAVAQTADTLGELLGACEAEYRVVAEAADRHASDVATLRAAWPR